MSEKLDPKANCNGLTFGDGHATNQKDGKGYTQKKSFNQALKNQSLDQVTDYNGKNKDANIVEPKNAKRTYYKKN